ncbi:uncharacterized protein C9orf40 homolog [Heterodontus francisci]|uniref:uncharacterized protein C9orf40 homolog n=1 Tax=Heterodontus francisci TaxID=7792 RepID=UPI00355B2A2E
MSKRKAEDILCYRPQKRFVSLFVDCKSVSPALSRDSSVKRKLQAGEPELEPEPACKKLESARRGAEPRDRDRSASGGWARGARGLGAGEPWATRSTACSTNLTGTALGAGPPQNAPWDEVSCQYNSFQFWRVPLPTIELAEIEDFGQPKIAEEMNCEDTVEAVEIEMELQN